MRKPFLFLFTLLICLITISDGKTQSTSKETEGVQDIVLDKTTAILACPWKYTVSKSSICNLENRQINISAIAKDAESRGLEFYYLVSGGKVIGHGKNVVWDFSDARPGRYLIGVGVGKDGIIQGKLITKSISVFECECHAPCECPSSIVITGPTAPTKVGEDMIFIVNVLGGSQSNSTFNWTISEGKITEGQGTSRISIKTTKEMKGRTITATVEVGGLCENCPINTASSTGEVTDK